jgi:hypothetical protein
VPFHSAWLEAARSRPHIVSLELAAAELVDWYTSHSLIRRLWAIEELEALRIVITLEPTPDGDDMEPAWLANSRTWAQELERRMHRTVRLELISDAAHIELILDGERTLVTAISWRDSSICG